MDSVCFLGFLDNEGCFSVSFLKNSNAFTIRVLVSQKGAINLPILRHFVVLFGVGQIEDHSAKDNFFYVVSGLKNVAKMESYFDKNLHHFLGIKKQRYINWKDLIAKVRHKQHLDFTTRKELQLKAKEINNGVA